MNLRIFIGIDPGAKGACAVLAVADCPGDESAHGRVVGVEVFDLPTVVRDGGGTELDVVAFRSALVRAAHRLTFWADAPSTQSLYARVVTERPQVTGGQRSGKVTLVTQAINVGAAWAVATAFALEHHGSSAWASASATGGWRSELGGGIAGPVAKGDEISRAYGVLIGVDRPDDLISSTDRAVAVLLAEVARRRWLGTAVVPQRKPTARQAAAKKAKERRAAIDRAVAPLKIAEARAAAIESGECPDHAHRSGGPHVRRPSRHRWCTDRIRCCEVRLLDWAWRQKPWRPRPDQPEPPLPGLRSHPVASLDRIVAIYRRTAVSRSWTIAYSDTEDTGMISDTEFDVLVATGLVQLVPGVRQVRYRPTERGLAWAGRLRAETETRSDAC